MAGRGSESSTLKLLSGLAAGKSYAQVAQEANVSERTISRRMADPAFRKRLSEVRSDALGQVVGLLSQGSAEAARTLLRLLTCGKPSIEARAAEAILDRAFRGMELLDLEERLAALETKVTVRRIR